MKVTFDWLLLFMCRFKGRDSSLPTVNIHLTRQPIGEEAHQAAAQPCAPAFIASLRSAPHSCPQRWRNGPYPQ